MADAPEEGDKKKSKKDDEIYEGDLKDGKRHGYGIFVFPRAILTPISRASS